MKALDKEVAEAKGAEPAGRAEVSVLPPSNAAAAAKGGWQASGALLSAALTILTALWFEPTVAATIGNALKDHPEWALYFAVANILFGFVRNRLAHRDPDSRLAIVGDPKPGSIIDRAPTPAETTTIRCGEDIYPIGSVINTTRGPRQVLEMKRFPDYVQYVIGPPGPRRV